VGIMDNYEHWSRLPGFFCLSHRERRLVLSSLLVGLAEEDFLGFDKGLALLDADRVSENVIGTFALPFSVAVNFIVDDTPVLVPMVTEEPSIVAASSKMAKLVGRNGGFHTTIDKSLLKGQIQIYQLHDIDKAIKDFETHKSALLEFARSCSMRMEERGGGIIDIGFRIVQSDRIGPMVVIEPVMDVVDAMGANTINSLVEALANKVHEVIGGSIGIKILSNLCDQRLAKARCQIRVEDLADDSGLSQGLMNAHKLIAAHAFAEADIYRGATHNKGILNGIDAVAIATGNDFRALEAGAHAFAAIKGRYQPLTTLWLNDINDTLCAELTMPLAVGVVGGLNHIHPGVKLAHKLLQRFSKSARGLASVMVSVGLSQCLAALLALTKEGIQQGHMKLHQKKIMQKKL
jgi:hydroxymethylglutaryl-CoA reductase